MWDGVHTIIEHSRSTTYVIAQSESSFVDRISKSVAFYRPSKITVNYLLTSQ